MKHTIKTVLLLTSLAALFMGLGYLLGGQSGMMMALGFSLLMNLGAYWFSDKIVLSMHGAKPLSEGDSWGVYAMVRELSAKAGLPMPKVYWIPDQAPNAFATGRNPEHAAVAVTQGLVDILSPRELRGVLAHELGHVKNRDILISTIVASIASAVMYLAHMLQWAGIMGGGHSRDGEGRGGVNPLAMIFTIVVAPLVATLIQMAVSRTREYGADETGAEVSDDPEALASALEKISNPNLMKKFQEDEAMPDMQPAFSHLYIVNHFANQSVLNWFSTHPPVKERVRRLRTIKGGY
ncbi:MAG: zinc metalloprotease HtpX [Candidatus Omnitrophica bacterium]|nr:zinc metalloprotease HtpX [Candidatus Omnitrophota bacterium]